jgi:hypothetical protein
MMILPLEGIVDTGVSVILIETEEAPLVELLNLMTNAPKMIGAAPAAPAALKPNRTLPLLHQLPKFNPNTVENVDPDAGPMPALITLLTTALSKLKDALKPPLRDPTLNIIPDPP